jgi:hypothetical protein
MKVREFWVEAGLRRLADMIEFIAVVAAILIAFLLGDLLISRVFGVSLLCHLGVHRWRRELVGHGRDARYVVKCRECEVLKDEA